MIQILGFKRIVLIVVLMAFNAALAAGLYMYILPEKESTQQQLSVVKGQTSTRRAEIAQLQDDFAKLEEQRSRFEQLKALGLFNEQDRVLAREKFNELQNVSRVTSVQYVISAADVEKNDDMEKADYTVLNSPVKVTLDALDDIDIYRFVYLLETTFPGHAGIDRIELKRGSRVNEAVLRQIGSGYPVVLVSGEVDFNWRTAVPKKDIEGMLKDAEGKK